MLPKAIVEARNYRKSVADDLSIPVSEPLNSDGEANEEQEVEIEPGAIQFDEAEETVKERTWHAFNKVYEEKGFDTFMETALKMKTVKTLGERYGHFKGELAEIVLYIIITEFIKQHNLPWKLYHSLVVPHKNGKKDATTECDLVLVSEEVITVFEAKSNTGKKTLTGMCTLHIPKRPDKDIWAQNSLHCESLLNQIEKHHLKTTKAGLMSAYFLYDDGTLKDDRDDNIKKIMPALNEKTILAYLSALTRRKTKTWSSDIFQVMDELSKKLTMEDHKNFISGGD